LKRVFLFALVLASCAAPPPAKSDAPSPRPLAGTSWVMRVDGASAAPTLEFGQGDRASGFTGCNQWFAQVDRSDGGLRFEAIGMTRRACDPAAMGLEHDFIDRLSRTYDAQIEDDDMTLTSETGEALARLERAR
jgi:heat shock protein HslJ